MKAASASSIWKMLRSLGGDADGFKSHAIAANAGFLVAKLSGSKLSLDAVHLLSSLFLQERERSAQRILGPDGYQHPGVEFVLFPVVECIACALRASSGSTIFLSLGLVETLRLSIAASQIDSCIDSLERSGLLASQVGPQEAQVMLKSMRHMTQYFNAQAVLMFMQPEVLPNCSSLLSPSIRRKVDVVLEAVLMFVLLHEMGHVEHWRAGKRDAPTADLVWEFAVAEDIDADKAEELWADAYALSRVPVEFQLPLVHAATFFLNLYNYVEASSVERSASHPLAVNRIAALYATARDTAAQDEPGHRAVQQATRVGTEFWAKPSRGASLQALKRYARRMSELDWGPAQQALMVLDTHAKES